MQTEVRVGVVGTSWWADNMHLPSIKSHPRARLAAICGRDRARADEMAAKYRIPAVYTDYREMMARGGLDAVVVSVPDDLHYPVTMAALNAGLHVMCEKPLALNAAQAREMYATAEAAGLKHGVLFTWTWLDHYRQLQRLVDEGYIGQPYHAGFQYLTGYARESRYIWRMDADRANGALGDIGSHMIQFARLYVGEIARVGAHLSEFVKREGEAGRAFRPANDAAALAVEFENGAQGTIEISAVAHVGERQDEKHVVLHGAAGTLESTFSFGPAGVELRGARAGEERFSDLSDPAAAAPAEKQMGIFRTEPAGDRAFIDAIVDDRPFAPGFYDGWRVQEVIDAAIRSHDEGRWVTVRSPA